MSGGRTPGPWRVRVNAGDDLETCDLSICGDIFVIADLKGPQYNHQHPNASLIATAPELLDVAITLRQHLALFCTHDDAIAKAIFDAADAAIAKAQGQSHSPSMDGERPKPLPGGGLA